MSGEINISDFEGDEPGVWTPIGDTYGRQTTMIMPSMSLGNGSSGEVEEEEWVLDFPQGWFNFGVPFDLSTITKIVYTNKFGLTQTVNNPPVQNVYYRWNVYGDFLYSNSLLSAGGLNSSIYDGQDGHETLNVESFFEGPINDDLITIIKSGSGNAYLPEWNYNGIGGIHKYEGMQIKSSQAFSITFTAKRNHRIEGGIIEYGSYIRIGSGWSFANWPLKYGMPVETFFSSTIDFLVMVKDFQGNAYLPEWGFNGIGDGIPGYSYHLKINGNNSIYEFITENE
tara:strand:+ start:3015 stop:3863 length:849 start_codon:yes stop_codon:yes gene_type:complete